ncbi:MAG: ATP-dependent Clp protease proteolytic subunit [SAR324 cluster bacterium]|nr:ATP-dependent Clp protease proteolytic subunit [SAR324 cluster bacterium]MBF0353471.1 ATP-dependent Clp protease proteolytic subunit [SAR324 cluster bacterium]
MEEQKEDMLEAAGLAAKLLESRTIVISRHVDSELTAKVLNLLILLEQSDPDKMITIIINSPGGEVFSGFAIFDMLRFISCPIRTIVSGFAASMGSILSLAAPKGRRFIMPNAKVMIHQPLLTGYQGSVIDCEIQAKQILKTRDKIIDIYCEATGKNYEEIKKALDRDNWLTAEEALAYGLIDKIIKTRKELNEIQ